MKDFLIFLAGGICGIIALSWTIVRNGETYKDGQVDALTGKVKYKLEVQPDSTTKWVYINGE